MPKLYDIEEDNENFYIIEEYLEGVLLSDEEFEKKPLSESRLLKITEGVVEFLDLLHEREDSILYLDWKPENVILTEEGVKFLDFGSATSLGEEGGIFLATEEYSAPELKSGKEVGRDTDIYGFGCLLKYLADRTEGSRNIFFQKSLKESVLKLSERCRKQKRSERCDLKEVKKEIRKLRRRLHRKQRETDEEGRWFEENTKTIGISGVFKGAGATYLSLSLVEKLAKKGKTAFVDFTKEGNKLDFEEEMKRRTKDIRFFQVFDSSSLVSVLSADFKHVVIDFGVFREGILTEFLRCEKRFVVVQDSLTKRSCLNAFLEKNRHHLEKRKMNFILNLSGEDGVRSLKKRLKKEGIDVSIVLQEFEPPKKEWRG